MTFNLDEVSCIEFDYLPLEICGAIGINNSGEVLQIEINNLEQLQYLYDIITKLYDKINQENEEKDE